MANNWILVEADDSRIGPGANASATAFATYDEAMAEMVRRIDANGGGEYSEDFGNGYTESPFITYEIFGIQEG